MPRRLPNVLNTVLIFAALIAVIYGGLIGALYFAQRNLLYHPAGNLPSPADSGLPSMRAVSLETADGLSLKSWYAPPAPGKPVILYFHGNAGHIGSRAFKAEVFLRRGFGLLLLSYRGFGDNPGKPTEEGLYHDGRAALGFLAGQGVPPGRTVLYGESLGTGVAVRMAAELAETGTPSAAVVLETPYTSITDVATSHYPFAPVRWLLKDRFDAADRIATIGAPVLILHAEDDRVIPIRLARRLFDLASRPKQAKWYLRGGHEGLFDQGAGDIIVEFVANGIDDK